MLNSFDAILLEGHINVRMYLLKVSIVPVSSVRTLDEQYSSTALRNTLYRCCRSALIVANMSPTGSGNNTRSMACPIAIICWFAPPVPLGDSTISLRCWCPDPLLTSSTETPSSAAGTISSNIRAPFTVST